MDKKTIRSKIYQLLDEKFGLTIGDLKKSDFKKLLKQLSNQPGPEPKEPKPEPKRNFNKPDSIRTWHSEE